MRVLPTLAISIAIAINSNVIQSVSAESPPLTSLHGTLITMVNDDESVQMEIWSKGDLFRGELKQDLTTVINIQRGAKVYTYIEGDSDGMALSFQSGLSTLSLLKQIEEIKRHGILSGSELIHGKIHDIYHYDIDAPAESALVYLSRETSLPRLWISVVMINKNAGKVIRLVYRDMEANIEIPDEIFAIPNDVKFTELDVRSPADLGREAGNEDAIEKPAPENKLKIDSLRLDGISEEQHRWTINYLTRYIQLLPKDPRGYINRGLSHYFLGEHDRAVIDFDSALKLVPDETSVYLFRGWARLSMKDFLGAIADFTRVIEREPKDAQAHVYRGSAWNQLNEDDKAIIDLDTAVRINPKSDAAFAHRGSYWFSQSNYANAIADWQKAWQLNPRRADVANELAWLLATCDQPEIRDAKRAIDLARRACDVSHWSDYRFMGTLAVAYAEDGNFSAAVERQTRSLEMAPEHAKQESQRRLDLYQRNEKFTLPPVTEYLSESR